MPGKHLSKRQVNLYMSNRKQANHTQIISAAKAGISERSARRIDSGKHQTTQGPRAYKTRKDPLMGLFETLLVPLLKANPQLQPITLLEVLQEHDSSNFDCSHLRTLQRRTKRWRAKHGPDQEVIFRQEHIPGLMGISDYTSANQLKITLLGEPFNHLLYHYRLVYSGWTYAQVILGGESFESLSSGLQNALWRCGGVPLTHRTDSLSAAFNNHYEQETLTVSYDGLCRHYHLKGTRNNKGIAHENGAIESSNGHLKRKIEQRLLLRGNRDFKDLSEYESFITGIVSKINRQCRTRFDQEKVHLGVLPERRTHDFSELYVKVTSSSTITVKRVVYTVPSRLIGTRLLVHIYYDHLRLFYGHESTLELARVYAPSKSRARSVDYRHVIHSLAKKPNAFKHSQLRDDLIPQGDLRILWVRMTLSGVTDQDCHYMVGLLLLAHNYNCEKALGRYVLSADELGKRVSINHCRKRFGPDRIEIPVVVSQQHVISSYDSLLGVAHG